MISKEYSDNEVCYECNDNGVNCIIGEVIIGDIKVLNAPHLKCSKCGDVSFELEDKTIDKIIDKMTKAKKEGLNEIDFDAF